MAFVEIQDASDPRLTVYRDLNQINLTRHSGRFIAESRLLVQRLLASSLPTESILCSERFQDELGHLAHTPLPVYIVPHALVSEIVGFKFHRGMLACGRRPDNPELDRLVPSSRRRRLLVVCPEIVDPSNLAGVIRNCSAFGADGLLLGPHCADAYSRRVVRVSMGTVFRLPVRIATDLEHDLVMLRDQHRYRLTATVLDPAATRLSHASGATRLALMFGGEGFGLADGWRTLADEQVTLPMRRDTDSLNLSTATGVFLYHYTHVAPLRTARDPVPDGPP